MLYDPYLLITTCPIATIKRRNWCYNLCWFHVDILGRIKCKCDFVVQPSVLEKKCDG